MSRAPQPRFRITRSQAATSAHIASRDPFKLERRREDRHEAEGSLRASYSAGPGHFGITNLDLVDRSPGGMAVETTTRINPGTIVTICPEGSTVPWLSALAVRCEPRGEVFRIGLRSCGPAAA
ncbi:MAG TPA: PilZ domain-containing protein [Phycisphaerales bacterium]|nr:PilZ domain-containing protein [Phycisphaerales bacterium]